MQSREEPLVHRDLGTLDDTVLLFGGPYSNAQATSALLAAAQALGISSERLICTGDVVAYCGAPRKTVDLIRSAGAVVVAGNCEKQLGQRALDCGCGFQAGTTCDLLSNSWYKFAQSRMRDADCVWMNACPDILSFRHHGKRYAVIHRGVSDIARFIWEASSTEVYEEEGRLLEQAIGPVDAVIAGHSGIPFKRATPQGHWINVGAIGMPPHDGSSQTRFATLGAGAVTFHGLEYDVASAQAEMRAAGLTQGYEKALATGYWPSEDVLPPESRVRSFASG